MLRFQTLSLQIHHWQVSRKTNIDSTTVKKHTSQPTNWLNTFCCDMTISFGHLPFLGLSPFLRFSKQHIQDAKKAHLD